MDGIFGIIRKILISSHDTTSTRGAESVRTGSIELDEPAQSIETMEGYSDDQHAK
jgi:hypothetical protein